MTRLALSIILILSGMALDAIDTTAADAVDQIKDI